MKSWRLVGCGAILAVSLGIGTPAWAQTSGGTYTGVAPPQLSSHQIGDTPTVAVAAAHTQSADTPSSLAFTGSDALELAAIGLVLIGSGSALRWSARARRKS